MVQVKDFVMGTQQIKCYDKKREEKREVRVRLVMFMYICGYPHDSGATRQVPPSRQLKVMSTSELIEGSFNVCKMREKQQGLAGRDLGAEYATN